MQPLDSSADEQVVREELEKLASKLLVVDLRREGFALGCPVVVEEMPKRCGVLLGFGR